ARAAGLPVTCGVAAVNLCLDDSLLRDFDTNYKVDPPLRSKRDVAALRNAVENGVIDVIVSDHMPWDVECKELEFDYAEPGIASIQTAFGCALDGLGTGSLQAVVQALTAGPRAVLGLPQVLVNEG